MEASGTPERKASIRSLVQKPETFFYEQNISMPKNICDKLHTFGLHFGAILCAF